MVRRVLNDSFIITRDSKGEIRAMFNMCLHRGMQVCRAEMGNASNFRCPYHGWSYRNDGRIIGLPFHGEAYGGEQGFKKRGQTLLPAPNLASYNGLIFMSMDPGAEPLDQFSATSSSISTSTPGRARPASRSGVRNGGASRPTGRSVPRTSPATCTTLPKHIRRS